VKITVKCGLFSLLIVLPVLFGCVSKTRKVEAVDQIGIIKCQQPVASIMVGRFECKSTQCVQPGRDSGLMTLLMLSEAAISVPLGDLGSGMSAMVTTALKESGCFDVQERQDMQLIEEELARVGKKLEVQQADYIISGTITDAHLSQKRSRFGGGYIPVVGSIRRDTKRASLDFDLKIIDVNKAKISAAKTFSANSESTATSANWFGYRDFSAFGGMAAIKGTPMEGVVREAMNAIVDYTSHFLINEKQKETLNN
jgi:curli biogenesis system outer membrane secretion channel CsgG